MKNSLLYFLLFLGLFNVRAQNITGYVYDSAGKIPLEGVFIYLDGTTVNASTDANGFFELKPKGNVNAYLVASLIGYDRYILEKPFDAGNPVTIYLMPNAINLDEIVVSKQQLFTRKQLLKAFKDQFLGLSANAASCTIENEEDIILTYDVPGNVLSAHAIKPLTIINKRLGYKIVFDLMEFKTYYVMKSVKNMDVSSSFFAGTTAYIEVATDKKTADKRKKAYLGSPMHFLRTVASGDWEKEKFDLYVDKLPASPEDYFKVTDTLENLKKVKVVFEELNKAKPGIVLNAPSGQPLSRLSGSAPPQVTMRFKKFTILYNGRHQSFISFNTGEFYIDQNGLFMPVTEIYFGGHMGQIKAGEMLPADYKYEP